MCGLVTKVQAAKYPGPVEGTVMQGGVMKSVMQHNGETGELVCFAPAGEEVLRMTEMDIAKAHGISAAIQEAYRKGSILGRLEMQRNLEQRMDELNRA